MLRKDYKQIIAKELIRAYKKGIKSIGIKKVEKEYDNPEPNKYFDYDEWDRLNDEAYSLEEEGLIKIVNASNAPVPPSKRIKKIKLVEERIEDLKKYIEK